MRQRAGRRRRFTGLLEYSPKKGSFSRNEDDPLEADVVIIDEVSMMDTLLMYHLLKAMPLHSHLILVGDVDQLPSVGPGTILRDIIDSHAFTVVRLTEIFRQSQESTIVVNAHRINRGEFPILKNEGQEEKGDFYFIEEEDPGEIVGKIIETVHSQAAPAVRVRFDPGDSGDGAHASGNDRRYESQC